jgi:hypothetical protein
MLEIDRPLHDAQLHGSIGILLSPLFFALALGGVILFAYALTRFRGLTQADLLIALLPSLVCGSILAWVFVIPALNA